MSLPNDVSRCLGSIFEDGEWQQCKKKTVCERAAAWYNAEGIKPTDSVPVAEYLCYGDPAMSFYIPCVK